jgi:hypothetical protein
MGKWTSCQNGAETSNFYLHAVISLCRCNAHRIQTSCLGFGIWNVLAGVHCTPSFAYEMPLQRLRIACGRGAQRRVRCVRLLRILALSKNNSYNLLNLTF